MTAHVVRYGINRLVGEFTAADGEEYRRRDEVIVRSRRGTEWGEVLCAATRRTGELLEADGPEGRILRAVTWDDREAREQRHAFEKEAFREACGVVAEMRLQMTLIECESLLGGEKLLLFFTAEKRVDFRQLVRALAKRFKTRIEMRQVGARDEAKLLADYGDCGKPVCCGTHLRQMPPVSMKMAKLQKATLDPAKITGRCGRLKCCLRYEYETYASAQRELPAVGVRVGTPSGPGRVVARQLLARRALVELESGRRVLAAPEELGEPG